MIHPRRTDEEQGQIALALLLVVVAVVALALVFAQVGSASEQKTQTRTAADAAAVAAAQELRGNRIWALSKTVPHAWAPAVFAPVPVVGLQPQAAACDALQRNWGSNPHGSGVSCGTDLVVSVTGQGAYTRVTAPAGEVVSGPVDASAERAQAEATAWVVLGRCPPGLGERSALARWLTDRTVHSFGAPSRCFTPADELVLRALDLKPGQAPAAIGEPRSLLTAVRNATRVEIIR